MEQFPTGRFHSNAMVYAALRDIKLRGTLTLTR
jgi:hypothetical protein